MCVKFLRLAVDSRVEIASVRRPKSYQAPSYRIYKYEASEALTVIFEEEVRIIHRYINPGYHYAERETAYGLPLGCRRISIG
jgi:hypothetical protein